MNEKNIIIKNGDWNFSIVRDGYGAENDLFEIGIWNAPKYEIRTRGWLTIEDVFKIYADFVRNPLKTYRRLN